METSVIEKQSLKIRAATFFKQLQETICRELEALDGKERFGIDFWTHPKGGGGDTRVIENGAVFEKGGVNFSYVKSLLSEKLAQRLNVLPQAFHATGISLVLHPFSPMIPTVHFNLRYLELNNGDCWFGGGMDLTPFYLFEEDAIHFHTVLKSVCDKHDPSFYPRFKQWCDEYFYLKHRDEARGIGGIFYDYLRENSEQTFVFIQDIGNACLDAYAPIVKKRRKEPWREHEKEWQLVRRGRYVEFNLLYDRGTLFGLETEGRIESILLSLPPTTKWIYNVQPDPGSREAQLLEVLRRPKDWIEV